MREIYPALSLGERLSFDVSEYQGLHPDIFELPGRGTFINNNPGASILGALPYALARPGIACVSNRIQAERARSGAAPPRYDTGYENSRNFVQAAWQRGLDVKLVLAAGVMQAFLMAPLAALAAVVMFFLLLSCGVPRRASVFLTFLYAFATPVFYRTAQLNHNVLIAHAALFSFALLWRPWAPLGLRRPRYFPAGLLAGYCLVLDYSGLFVLAALSGYALLVWRRQAPAQRAASDLARYAAGATLAVAVLLAYQWHAFGNPLTPAQALMPATAYSGIGVRGIGWPDPGLLWQTAFGLRFGLFTSAPLLLLALYPPAWAREDLRLFGKPEALLALGLTVALFLFSAANQYGWLQFNSGVRYMVPVAPFLFLVAAGVLRRLPTWIAVLIGSLTAYWSWCLAMYRDVERGYGVLESIRSVTMEGPRLPWVATLERLGYLTPGTWTLPVLAFLAAMIAGVWLLPDLSLRRRGRSASSARAL